MAANTNPIYPLAPKFWGLLIENADSTGRRAVVTAGVDGSRIDSLKITSTDTANMVVNFDLQIAGSGDYLHLGEVQVPDGSGTNSADIIVDALDILTLGRPIMLGASDVLYAAVETAVTAAKQVAITAYGGDY